MTDAVEILRLSWETGEACFREIAALHAAEIRHGALPLFGIGFLARLYRELARTPGCGVWAAVRGDRVYGFLIGCVDLRAGFGAVLLRAGLPLLARAVPRLLRWKLLRKLPAVLLYPLQRSAPAKTTQPAADSDRSELLAIAVDPACRGEGVGRELVRRLEDFLCRHGAGSYRVTTNAADPSSNAFYRRLGFEPAGKVPHHALCLQQYRKRLRVVLAPPAPAA